MNTYTRPMFNLKSKIATLALVYLTLLLVMPLFPNHSTELSCECGDSCPCDMDPQMSCGMEMTSCDAAPLLPLTSAPLNTVSMDDALYQHIAMMAENDRVPEEPHFSAALTRTFKPESPAQLSPILLI